MEKYFEQSDDTKQCRYGLASIESCRQCLFETLCRLERLKEERAKQEG